MAGNPWGAVMAGAGQGIMALNDYMTSADIEKAIRDSIRERSFYQDQMDESLMGQIGNLRSMTPEQERANAMNEFTTRLRAARATQPVSYGARGTVSDREAADMQELQGDLGEFAGREADIGSRIDSQRRMRENQDRGIARTGTDMRLIQNKMSSRDFLNELRIKRKSAKNPWLDMLGEGLKAAGGAMAGGMGGGGGGGGGSSAAGMSQMGGSMSSAK